MRFFFYGTLMDGSDNPVARRVHALLRPLGRGTVCGTIFAVPDPDGWYPALVSGDGLVHGRLYEAADGFGEADLARMDAYEDCDPGNPGASLYNREVVRARAADGTAHDAQAYLFNQPLPAGSRCIEDGDFPKWLSEQGGEPFRGRRSG